MDHWGNPGTVRIRVEGKGEGMVIKLTDASFEQEVLQADVPVLVDFYADWCGPCKMMAPAVEEIAKEYEGKVKVCNINIDDNGATPGRYGVMSIPTFLVIKGGEVQAKEVGAVGKAKLVEDISKVL